MSGLPADWLAAALGDARTALCVTRERTAGLVAALETDGRRVDWATGEGGLALLAGRGRYDAALVVDHLEHVPPLAGRQLLARLRDLHAHRVTAIVDAARLAGWSAADWRALEFVPAGDAGPLRRYAYDILTYNPPREWNQPTHWANPRNFDRYRW